jgi:protein-tyrosine-phosphatase
MVEMLGMRSNLLAHHLDVLERAGLISRTASAGDRRRRYVRLAVDSLDLAAQATRPPGGSVLFVCSQNSARSQLAMALWGVLVGTPAESAGTRPARRVHPGAVAAARRAGLDLCGACPRRIDEVEFIPDVIVTVCDEAHEELAPHGDGLHWSIVDPVPRGTAKAFDRALGALRARISNTFVATGGDR